MAVVKGKKKTKKQEDSGGQEDAERVEGGGNRKERRKLIQKKVEVDGGKKRKKDSEGEKKVVKEAGDHGSKKRKKEDSPTDAKDKVNAQRKERKQLRVEVAQEAKKIWEKLRDKKERENVSQPELVGKLMETLQGDFEAFSHRHDTSRVIQWSLKCGTKEQRSEVIQALLPYVITLSSDRYGRHVILSAMSKGRATRAELLTIYEKIRGNVFAMTKNSYSAEVLDNYYQTVANASQRRELCIELLHGRQFKILAATRQKKEEVNTLEDAIRVAGKDFGKLVYEAARTTLTKFSEKEGAVRMQIVHDALGVFLDYACENEKAAATEMAILYAPLAVHLVHTKTGVASFVQILKLLDAKNRKKVVKSVQDSVPKIAEDNFGHMAIMALYEQVDDTKLIQKSVLKNHLGKTSEETIGIICDKYSSLPLLNMLAPRQGRYFHPGLYSYVWTGETTSLKDEQVRRKELLEFALPILKEAVTGGVGTIFASSNGARIILEMIVSESPVVDEKFKKTLVREVAEALEKAATEEPTEDGDEGADDSGSILKNSNSVRTAKYLVTLTNNTPYSLGEALVGKMGKDLRNLSENGGGLIVRQMSKTEGASFQGKASKVLKV